MNRWGIWGGIFGGLGVIAGAIGAHALQASSLPAPSHELFRTAVTYQLIHALALFALGTLPPASLNRPLRLAGLLWSTGIVLFCGTLYTLALYGERPFPMSAPIGGSALILAWFVAAIGVAWRVRGTLPKE